MSSTVERRHDQRSHLRLSLPPRATIPSSTSRPSAYPFSYSTPTPSSSSSSQPSQFPFSPSTYTSATPSKRRRSTFTLSSSSSSSSSSYSSFSSLFVLLFSLRSLYSLLPFIRSSSSSFSFFPFSFLVSLFSFLFTSAISFILPSSADSKPTQFETLASRSFLRPLAVKSLLLALVFLLRFQSLRSCGTATTILVDFSGSIAARSFIERNGIGRGWGNRKVRGVVALSVAVLLQSYGWHRVGCSFFSRSGGGGGGGGGEEEEGKEEDCLVLVNVLLPFLSGFLGYLEHSSANWGDLKPLGRKRIRLFSLAFSTMWLFFPAFVSFVVAGEEVGGGNGEELSIWSLGWPLVNTVIFGVVLGENNGEDRSLPSSNHLQREFLVTFLCTLVLELFYFPRFSLPWFLLYGFLMWIAVNQLCSSDYIELGSYHNASEQPPLLLYAVITNPIRHILNERKSRKIALFLLINTAYMVVEFVAGFMSNSLGLISDACHMLFDCAALAIGLYASYISRLPADTQFNYGLGRFEVLSGYVNAVLLVLVGALIVLESFERILDPQEISTDSLLAVSIGGLLVNVVGLVFFHEEHHLAHGAASGSCSHNTATLEDHSEHHHHHHCSDHSELHDHKNAENPVHIDVNAPTITTTLEHHHHCSDHSELHDHHDIDHNMEGIFLHVLADTLGSVGVIFSTLLIKYKGWVVSDPACSIFISLMIVSSVLPLLINSAEILLQRVSKSHEKNLETAMDDILRVNGVAAVQNMHVWNFTNSQVVGTLNLLASTASDVDSVKKQVSNILLHDVGIKDLTLQIECKKA